MDVTGDPALRDPVSPFLQLLWERGAAHEREVVAALGEPFLDLSGLAGDEKEAATRAAIARREPLIYNGRLSVHELLGEPDLLRYEGSGYAAIDIKSGAGREDAADEEEGEEGRPRGDYGVQIALYTDILLRMDLAAGRHGYILDVHRRLHRYDLDAPLGPRSGSLWELYLKSRAALLQSLQHAEASLPARSSRCSQCVWRSACMRVLREARDLTLIPDLGRKLRDVLKDEFPTLADLAAANIERYIDGGKSSFQGVGAKRLRRFQRRAALQLAPDAAPCLTRQIAWPERDVELFFDIETDPLRDLCYLHGFVIRERGATAGECFRGIFAADPSPDGERDAFAEALALLRHYPEALVIHYSKYERTWYRRLQQRYPDVATEVEIGQLFAGPRALDLFRIVQSDSEWPTLDYSVKSLAKYLGFAWRDPDPSGASSIEWFDQWARQGDPALRQRLLAYNEDDCRAMRVVLDKMKTLSVQA